MKRYKHVSCLNVGQPSAGAHPLAHPIGEEAWPFLLQGTILQEVLGPELVRMTPQLGILEVRSETNIVLS